MTYPDGIDALVNVNATDTLAAGGHAARHNSTNTALAEVQSFLALGVPLIKADVNSVAFTKTGAGTLSIKAGTIVGVDGTTVTFGAATAVGMPSLTAGTDYFIYATSAGAGTAIAATGTWPTPVASPPANSRLIGGFHYAPGGNAAAQDGGDTTPAINEYSFWDLKWKPVAPDPRGMTLVANRFWSDIYLLNRDPQTHGTSKNGQPIADGQTASTTTCIVPAAFGGNGSTRYATQSWWNTAEALSAFGKRLPRYSEFGSLAYGVKENVSLNADPVNTGLVNGSGSGTGIDTNANKYTSKWGVIQATGNMWVWGDEFGGGNAAASWEDVNGGRGQVFQQENAGRLGGDWDTTVNTGSRASRWSASPSDSFQNFGGRGVCDHLILV
jgi:hypothetical protein